MTVAFVLGGARSGKSAVAERLAISAAKSAGSTVLYIATAQAIDAEMEKRISRHVESRPSSWLTVEEPLQVAARLRSLSAFPVIIIDCLSLLVNNWMFLESCDESGFLQRAQDFLAALAQSPGLVVCVSNEVGQGIVPADVLTRQYRDWLGWLNQKVAACAQSVYWVAAGIAVELKAFEASI